MGEVKILDLNKIKPPERKVKLLDKEINTSKIPSEITLEIIEKYEELNDPNNPQSLSTLIDLSMKVINAQNNDEEITKKWLVKNTDFKQLYALIEFIMEPIKETAEKRVDNGKNTETPAQK